MPTQHNKGLFASHFLEHATWENTFLYFAPMLYTTAVAYYFNLKRAAENRMILASLLTQPSFI